MNIVLKDPDTILLCVDSEFKLFLNKCKCTIWISELSKIKYDFRELNIINSSIVNKNIAEYKFGQEDMKEISHLFNSYSENISVEDAAAMYMAKKLEDCIIISRNGIFKEICDKEKIENHDFNWLFEKIIEKK